MSKLSKDAFAIMAMCEKTKEPFGITVDPRNGYYAFAWAYSASQTSQACGLVKGILPGVYIVPSEFCRLSYITYKNLSYCVRLSTRFYR